MTLTVTAIALAAEITNDPAGLGYAALVSAHNRIGIAAKLNATHAGVGTVYRNDVNASEILACFVESELSGLTQVQWTRVLVLLTPGTVDASQQTIRDQFAGIFAGHNVTLTTIATIIQKVNPTRAEELWGYGTVITDNQIAAAGIN